MRGVCAKPPNTKASTQRPPSKHQQLLILSTNGPHPELVEGRTTKPPQPFFFFFNFPAFAFSAAFDPGFSASFASRLV
jgi:hypothetical protein